MRIRELEAKYVYRNIEGEKIKIDSPAKVQRLFAQLYPESSVERFIVFYLDNKNTVNGFSVVSQGTVSEAIIHPREVFKGAILHNASSVIIAHNHPSGDTTPSNEDVTVTKRLVDAGKILGIKILDHVVVDTESNCFLSMAESNLMIRM